MNIKLRYRGKALQAAYAAVTLRAFCWHFMVKGVLTWSSVDVYSYWRKLNVSLAQSQLELVLHTGTQNNYVSKWEVAENFALLFVSGIN